MKNLFLFIISFFCVVSFIKAQEDTTESMFDYTHRTVIKKQEKINDSPYAMFGDNTAVLKTRHEERSDHSLKIPLFDNDVQTGLVKLNFQTGIVSVFDIEKKLLKSYQLTTEQLARFLTIDPMAEKYYGWSPYAYVKNNPMRLIDPTGLYDIDAIEINKQYGTIAVYQSDYAKIDKDNGNTVLTDDIQAARDAGVPVIFVDDIADYADAMAAIGGRGASTETYTLNSHGNEGFFYIGNDVVSKDTNVSSLKDGLSGKNVFIGACSVTSTNAGVKTIENFSTQTNSTVIASDQGIPSGYNYAGNGLNGSVGPRGFIGNMILGENHQNSYHVAAPGQSAQQVYNVVVTKNGSVGWNSGNQLNLPTPRPLTRR